MDRVENTENAWGRAIEHSYNFDADSIKFVIGAAKTLAKLALISFRELGYMFTAVLTFPKERWGTLKDYRKSIKTAFPLIFGLGTYFLFWNAPLGVPLAAFILLPSSILYARTSIPYAIEKIVNFCMENEL